jgi:cytochrome c oxidase subunit 2
MKSAHHLTFGLMGGGLLCSLTACHGWQSVTDPQGEGANTIDSLFWLFIGVCIIIWMAVVLALCWSLVRGREDRPDPLEISRGGEKKAHIAVTVCIAVTVVTLVLLTCFSYMTGKSLAALNGRQGMTVQIIGHQWWWEVRYDGVDPSHIIVSANEIHIPVGEPVTLKLKANDVIHSLWIPVLNGKRDLIPGREETLTIQADRPGLFRGQCAEFCGLQHAHMGLFVVAESRAEFETWRRAETASSNPPVTAVAQQGAELFMRKGCLMCHTVRGTNANGQIAPDLTHVASRRSIAADTLPMSHDTLVAWLTDPQSVKPGTDMPRTDLTSEEIAAIATYLEDLK